MKEVKTIIILTSQKASTAINQTFYCTANKPAHDKTCERLLMIHTLIATSVPAFKQIPGVPHTSNSSMAIQNFNKHYRMINKSNEKNSTHHSLFLLNFVM